MLSCLNPGGFIRDQEEKRKCLDIAEPEKKGMGSTMPTGVPRETSAQEQRAMENRVVQGKLKEQC